MDQNEIMVVAENRAKEMLREAEQRAERLNQQSEAEAGSRRTEADAYALRSLRAMERELNALSGSVRKGIDLLATQQAALSINGRSDEGD